MHREANNISSFEGLIDSNFGANAARFEVGESRPDA